MTTNFKEERLVLACSFGDSDAQFIGPVVSGSVVRTCLEVVECGKRMVLSSQQPGSKGKVKEETVTS